MQSGGDHRALEREALRNVIAQWNANRLDIFELSEPNEDLEFHGVMRFYFQDSGQKVATKCIRVASDATVEDVIGTLIEKFRPDMRMLSVPSYALFELHEHCPERKMSPDEKPLLVQLNWHVDDREGRFLLKNVDDKTSSAVGLSENNSSFRRKLSKREKKQLKKQEKLSRIKKEHENGEDGVAEKLYTELPETSFTRSISNPEAVMRRRRQQKLEQKLKQFRSKDGGPDTGGTLKIYGEALCKDVPYKTLLLSVRDCAGSVVREMLEKYGLSQTDPSQWCLVQVTQQPGGPDIEYVLDDDECPLSILMNSPSTSSIMFHVKRRPADCAPRKRKKKPGALGTNNLSLRDSRIESSPYLIELGPDGSPPHLGDPNRTFKLNQDVMEVGSANGIALQLYGPHIQSRHCVITNTDGYTSITPCHVDAATYVNGQRIHQTTILTHGSLVKFGNSNTYRFLDHEDMSRRPSAADISKQYDHRSQPGISPPDTNRDNFETTFDLEGNVETISTASGPRDDTRSMAMSYENNSVDRYPKGQDAILPAVLEFLEEPQEQFLARIITHLDVSVPSFKLAPAYTLYLCARYRASTHYRPELTPTERAHKLTLLLQHAAMLVRHTVQDRSTENPSQAFWLANASELLHFLKSDRHVSAFSIQAQDILADSVQLAFKNLVACLTDELNSLMPSLMSHMTNDPPTVVINMLGNTMNLLRMCRVNAALTIQLFSQLFHWIAAKSLSIIISNPHLCTRSFGNLLFIRLRNIQNCAETLGLELAAECHLAKILQCVHLLQGPKSSAEDLANLSSTCFKLNSLQIRALLTQYKCEPGEIIASPQMLEQAARASESVADELARAEGKEVRLHEDLAPPLQLLLPDDGYSCDVVQGVPQGLADFLLPLQAAGLCRLAAQPTSSGLWTVYMTAPRPTSAMSSCQPEIQVIKLHKSGGGMGLSIVAAKGAGQERLGIYIKSVVPGGAADRDGRLTAGDQLLSVDGHSLLGITQEKAAEFLVRTGSIVTLEVAKGGAVYHGLATLLQQPSPTPHRAKEFVVLEHPMKPNYLFFNSDESLYKTEIKLIPRIEIKITDCSDDAKNLQKTKSLDHEQDLIQVQKLSLSLQDLTSSSSSINSPYNSNVDLSRDDLKNNKFWKSLGEFKTKTLPEAVSYPEINKIDVVHANQRSMSDEAVKINNEDEININEEASKVEKDNEDDNVKIKDKHVDLIKNKLSDDERLEIMKVLYDWNVNTNDDFNSLKNSKKVYCSLPNIDKATECVINNAPLKTLSQETLVPRKLESDFMHFCKFTNCIFNYDFKPPTLGTNSNPPAPIYASDTYTNYRDKSSLSKECNNTAITKCCYLATDACPIYRKFTRPAEKRPTQNNCPRRMSERDLPSKIDKERTILSSKSVPALHHLSPGAESRPISSHEAFSPSYSRTSSNNSINANAAQGVRSRSTHNLHHQQDSNFYQNLSVFRNKPVMSPTQQPQQLGDRTSILRSSQNSLQSNALSQRPTSVCYATNNNTNRALHNSIPNLKNNVQQRIHPDGSSASYPNINHQNYTLSPENLRHQHQHDDPNKQVLYGNISNYPPRDVPNYPPSMKPLNLNIENQKYDDYNNHYLMKEEPISHKLPISKSDDMLRYASSGNIHDWEDRPVNNFRGQAKMMEMGEELRRRQLMQQKMQDHQMMQNTKSLQNLHMHQNISYQGYPKYPPVAPKPKKQEPELLPELPPTSTHPLYSASAQEPPRMMFSTNSAGPNKQPRDPWVREEQERQEQYRRELSRQWQEQQIKDLSSIPQRTPHQEEQLRVLQFEREFQRRAQEAAENDDDDTEKGSPTIASNPIVANKVEPLSILKPGTTTAPPKEIQETSAPPPPERGCSYAIMSMRSKEGPKRVSFNDPFSNPAPPPVPDSLDLEERREDPNLFIKQAESILASPNETSEQGMINMSTPGVIGAQEFYRDPRTKRLAEQAQQKAQIPVPEKLSFKEKMKMFAMETGEQETPKDKSKISRAQREIDSIGSPNPSMVH